ncbi:GNAT family N-acetyltransferase [soil metagenome]|jgi:predicted GNAT family acetyltransferase
MNIKNEQDGKHGRFVMEDDGVQMGMMVYVFSGPAKMIIEHTEVDEAYEGKGLGRQLVKAGVEYAREQHIKILPLCPFAKKIFDLTPGYADVLF